MSPAAQPSTAAHPTSAHHPCCIQHSLRDYLISHTNKSEQPSALRWPGTGRIKCPAGLTSTGWMQGSSCGGDREDLDRGACRESALAGRDRPPGGSAGELADRASAAPGG